MILFRNLGALRRSRQLLDGRPPSTLRRVAWLISLFAAWTGPLMGGFWVVAVALGFFARRGEANPRTRLASRMAIENGAIGAVAITALVGLLYWGAP